MHNARISHYILNIVVTFNEILNNDGLARFQQQCQCFIVLFLLKLFMYSISDENRKVFHEQETEKTLLSLLSTEVSISNSSVTTKFCIIVSIIARNNHQRCSIKKVVLQNFLNFTRKQLCQRCSITKAGLKHFSIFSGKHLFWSLFLIELKFYS